MILTGGGGYKNKPKMLPLNMFLNIAPHFFKESDCVIEPPLLYMYIVIPMITTQNNQLRNLSLKSTMQYILSIVKKYEFNSFHEFKTQLTADT